MAAECNRIQSSAQRSFWVVGSGSRFASTWGMVRRRRLCCPQMSLGKSRRHSKRIPEKHLGGFKKSCFITISRFLVPKMLPKNRHRLICRNLILLCPQCQMSPERKKQFGSLPGPHPFFEAEAPSGTKVLELDTFMLSEGNVHLYHFKREGFF